MVVPEYRANTSDEAAATGANNGAIKGRVRLLCGLDSTGALT